MKKVILFLGILLISGFFVSKTYAFEYDSTGGIKSSLLNGPDNINYIAQGLGDTLSGTSTDIKIKICNANDFADIKIREWNSYSDYINSTGTNSEILALGVNTHNGCIDPGLDIATSTHFTYGKYYVLYVNPGAFFPTDLYGLFESTPNEPLFLNGTSTNPKDFPLSVPFTMWVNLVGVSNNFSANVSFLVPTASSTTNFGLWKGQYSYATSSDFMSVAVVYGTSTPPTTFRDFEPVANSSTSAQTFVLNRTHDLPSDQTSYAYMVLYDHSQIVATSSIISFTAGPLSDAIYPVGPNNPPSFNYDQCTQYGSFLGFSPGNMLCNLFSPHAEALNQFTTIGPLFASKSPWGDIITIQAYLSNLSGGTPNAPVLTPTGGPLKTFRDAMTMLLWLSFAVWIILRIRHLEL